MGPWDMKPPQPSKPTSIFPAFLGIPNSPVSGTRFAKSRRSVEWNAGSARWETWQRSWRIWYSNQLSHGCFNRNAYNGLLKQSPHSRGSILNPRYIYIYTLNNEGFFHCSTGCNYNDLWWVLFLSWASWWHFEWIKWNKVYITLNVSMSDVHMALSINATH